MKRSLPSLFLAFNLLLIHSNSHAAPLNISQTPLFLTDAVAPLTMLVLSRDHKLYFEAYNDASDLNNDGQVNTVFNPSFDYYGYFDSYKCYSYNSSQLYFYPVSVTATKKCPGQWSGNFLNYLTTARLDAIRKVLYGGYRVSDTTTQTILERTYIPQDGHSWGKEYRSALVDGYNISEYTPFAAPTSTNYHLFANTTLRNSSPSYPLLRVSLNQPYRIWEWVSIELPVAGSRAVNGGNGPLLSNITDYVVRVKVCDNAIGLESNCVAYPSGSYKPVGLLQQFGENDSMLFGLLTGSYKNNLAGGVLRKNISSIRDEINLNTGQFTTVNGIISTINKLTVTGFDTNYNYTCGFITTRNIVNGECEMWGNPLAEMLYEAVRYFAGKSGPTTAFNYSTGPDVTLGLAKPNWQNPYATYPSCSKANLLIISDQPNYDSDQLPGSSFNSFSGDLTPSLNVSSLAQSIFSNEGFASILAFIGQSGSNADGSPTPKVVSSFANVRGLAPQETNSEGSYYLGSVATYAWLNDLNSVTGKQNAKTFSVALASPQPEIKFKVGNNTIRIVPFAKSVAGLSINNTQGAYQPTNEIIDFYIESLTATGGVFRVNFADLQQGADFDMDAIVKYTVVVNPNNTLTITTDSVYAAGGINQHLGYVISGTTQDGVYLEVRDRDTAATSDVDYFLDTPPGKLPGQGWNDKTALPILTSRTFTPSNVPSAIFFNSPLWYAAKWGGFNDLNNNNIPDAAIEYDSTNSGSPDNYFLITNASNLFTQLAKVFQNIVDQSGTFTSATLNSGVLSSGTFLYQATFRTKDWSGRLLALALDPTNGNVLTSGYTWDAAERLKLQNFNTGRNVITYKPSQKKGIPFRWPTNAASPGVNDIDLAQVNALNNNPATNNNDNLGNNRLNFIRGDRSREIQNGGTFRNRGGPLGDIIDSAPLLIKGPEQTYPDTWTGTAAENSIPYSTFKTNNAERAAVIYVGANDGMLHALDANNGNELFAYVPSSVFSNLNQLTNPNYTHRYYVDGSINASDVLINNTWRTALVGSLNGGGQGMYALDITNPTLFNESNAANLVLWEFTDQDDIDMGYSYSQASIVRLANGKWAAIFGNGYNNTFVDNRTSTTGNAVIYVVDIANGTLIKKFDTQTGLSADPTASGRPNGMSTPVVVDIDNNYIADYIYAGDLYGNLWKIDIRSSDPNQWDFSYKTATTNKPSPFFVATNASGVRQPITSKPAVSRLNFTSGALQIYIGTGKFLETADKTDNTIQSVYALRDTQTTAITGRSVLQQQTILDEQNNIRITSNNAVGSTQRGWYIDLVVNGQAQGERVISNLFYLNGKIIFNTIIPSDDPCSFGGDSWLMELDATTGSRLNYNVFDLNQDSRFTTADSASIIQNGQQITVSVSGLKSETGLIGGLPILNAGQLEYKYLTGTSGGTQKVTENPGQQAYGRQSWRQLQ
ncbi:type IV fimbrial biogenesis PilY1-like protein [Legionella beliardensis]|uniref:Type IV fimbrial biogenesis PilY1-like protein n=1 Tax=Legionella beliardensis TaxID=91822 RepID=A0A378HZ81_9GAMM|nr:PilC/PilY family type IV pilus protein [Legionella beliardensis]STX28217.1 type IV fimbrial biogenesis PilY1-like protein [Legionella beliardensis]